MGFWVGFWVGLRARDFPTERVLSRTPLIIRTVDQTPDSNLRKKEKKKLRIWVDPRVIPTRAPCKFSPVRALYKCSSSQLVLQVQ